MANNDGGVILTDGITHVALVPSGPVGLGHPTRIEVISGPFSVITEAEAWSYERFRDALASIHQTLSGEAKLTFVDGGHSVTLIGDGAGKVHAKVTVTDGRGDGTAILTVKLQLDQSYLPDVIHTIRREFLAEL